MNEVNRFKSWQREIVKIIGFLIITGTSDFLIASNTFYIEAEEDTIQPSKRDRAIEWLHAIHSPKELGAFDPYFPTFIKFRPTTIPLPSHYKIPNSFLTPDGKLDLRTLNAHTLKKLPRTHLKALMEFLSHIPAEIKWSDKKGHTQSGKNRKHKTHILSHWDKSNAAAAIALTMAIQRDTYFFLVIIGLVPEAILPQFTGHIPALIDAKMMSRLFRILFLELDELEAPTSHIAALIGTLTHRSFNYWVGKDRRLLEPCIIELINHVNKMIEKHPEQFNERNRGIIFGSILAGVIKHITEIRETDEKRIWIIGLIANLVWAATSFIGMAPIATPVACAAAGGISVGAVLASAVCTALEYPRDYSSFTKQLQGRLELDLLDAVRSKRLEEKIDILMMFKYMSLALHINGFSD